jgi:uncharacterized protein (TIGR02466 family)
MTKIDKLQGSVYFGSPIYSVEIPEWVNDVNKICDKYVKDAKKNNIKIIKEREKKLNKKIGDHGMSHHSMPLVGNPGLKQLEDYIGTTSWNLLDHMGYDLKNYELFWTEFWVQEFGEKGGGHHEGHIHYDNHISGFYFLKCSEKTSMPVFHDPRLAKLMIQLPLKNEQEITLGTHQIHYKPKPGTMILFPAYMEHQFVVDNGIEPFRFIHFNLQAVRKIITDTVRVKIKTENKKEKK